MLEAVAGTAIGIALLVWNDISAKALLYVVAGWAIAIGVLMLVAAIQLPRAAGSDCCSRSTGSSPGPSAP